MSDLVLIHGDERYLVNNDLTAWRAQFAGGELGVETFDAPAKLDPVRRSLTEVPLFDPERAVVIRNPPQLTGTARRGADAGDAFVDALEARAPTTAVCIAVHATVAASNVVLAAVTRLGGRVVHHPRRKGRDLRTWFDGEVRARELRLPRGAAEHLLAVAGFDLGALASELDKLVAYADPSLTLDTVKRLCGGDENVEVWNVLDKLLGPRPAEGVVSADALLSEGRSSQYLLVTLAGQLRELRLAQAIVSGDGPRDVASQMRIPPWRAERLTRHARRVRPELAEAWLAELWDLDRGTKLGTREDTEGLRLFVRRAAAALTAG